jgi:PHD/YefM family antitoxin component YafN of YafNO toxin-antitoxin module
MAEARERLTRLPELLAEHPEEGAVAITRRGEPVLAVLSWDLYESIIETLEVMSDPELMEALRKSIEPIEAGHTVPWETVKERLGT